MSYRWVGTLCACLAASTAAAALDTTSFPFVRDLALERPGTLSGVAVCELDDAAFDVLDKDFGNLRVTDGPGGERPCVVRVRQEVRWENRTVVHAAKTLNFRVLDTNAMEILVHFEDWRTHPVSGILIRSPLRDFEKMVSVYAGPDRAASELVCEGKAVFDYSRFIDVRNETVAFDAVSRPYFRIIVSNIIEEHRSPVTSIASELRDGRLASEMRNASFVRHDYRVDEVKLVETQRVRVEGTTVTRAYGSQEFAVARDESGRATIVTFRTRLAPLTELRVAARDRNFVRPVEVEARGGPGSDVGEWRRVGGGRIARLSIPGFETDEPGIALGGVCRFREYRLTIRDEDSAPLDIEGVAPIGPVHEVVFHHADTEGHRLWLGGVAAQPRYDIEGVLRKADGAGASEFRASLATANHMFQVRKASRFNGRTALTAAIVVAALLLAWVIATSARRMGAG